MSSARLRPRPYHCSSSLWGPLSADHMSPPSMNSSTSMGGLTQNPAHAHHESEAETSSVRRLLVDHAMCTSNSLSGPINTEVQEAGAEHEEDILCMGMASP